MNAYGVTTSTNSTGSAATASSASGKTASDAGFAGALVQAMEGTGTNGVSVAGTGIPAGLLGLLGLFGSQSADSASQDLLTLLSGLSDQLSALDPNAALPQDLQDQMAALLQMFQELLKQSGLATFGETAAADLPSETVSGGHFSQNNANPNGQPLILALQQSLGQLTDRLAKGEMSPVKFAAITEPVKTALTSLQQLAGSSVSAKQDKQGQPLGTQTAATDAVSSTSGAAAAPNFSAEQTVTVHAEIRKTAVPLRNPAWQFQAAAGTETGTAIGTGPAVAIETAEATGQNGTAPVWTFLKGDGVTASAPLPANAALPAQVSVHQFAEQIGKYLVKQFILTQGNGIAEAKISLHPEHLGQVDIKIMMQNGQLTAQFMTESGVARDLLENQMSQLRTALQGQGLQVDKMEVVQMSSSASTASFFQQNQGHAGTGQQGSGTKGHGSQGLYDDPAAFEAELDRSTYLREFGYGSSLNVTA